MYFKDCFKNHVIWNTLCMNNIVIIRVQRNKLGDLSSWYHFKGQNRSILDTISFGQVDDLGKPYSDRIIELIKLFK